MLGVDYLGTFLGELSDCNLYLVSGVLSISYARLIFPYSVACIIRECITPWSLLKNLRSVLLLL